MRPLQSYRTLKERRSAKKNFTNPLLWVQFAAEIAVESKWTQKKLNRSVQGLCNAICWKWIRLFITEIWIFKMASLVTQTKLSVKYFLFPQLSFLPFPSENSIQLAQPSLRRSQRLKHWSTFCGAAHALTLPLIRPTPGGQISNQNPNKIHRSI